MPQSSDNAPSERAATVLETDEDLREALVRAYRGKVAEAPEATLTPPPPAFEGRAASPYRPVVRPSVPILTVCDDGRNEGETVRIREPKFMIGRAEGDLRFPMDGRMSARHVAITHQVVGGLHRWVVTDLQSTHGMFVRVSRTTLADGAELIIGGGHYRFDAAQAEPDATVNHLPNAHGAGQTQGLDAGAGAFRPAALTEMLGREIGNRVLLTKGEYWVGSDTSCQVSRPDDPFCEPRHARLFRGSRGHWTAEHNQTLNGLWLRMTQITVEAMVQFQIGEQRFKLRVGG